ncbi:MAG: hypothetical protein JNL60_02115 [Bacteroidia bacterium]|nr:hypothetical protein [Bacteroidia bacterium]
MKIVLWIGSGANQRALANKISQRFKIDAIVVEEASRRNPIDISAYFSKISSRLFFSVIPESWSKLMDHYNTKYPAYPESKVIKVDSINHQDTYATTRSIKPDLIIVSGTSLIRDELLSINPPFGIVNLHTGLSPYMKGGPNCTNWCIANGQFHLIGNTIMWIDKGIDSGDIISSETVSFNGNETLFEVHYKVMEQAHELYVKAIAGVLDKQPIKRIKQKDIGEGKTYFRKNWDLSQQARLVKNFKNFEISIKSDDYKSKKKELKTFPFEF